MFLTLQAWQYKWAFKEWLVRWFVPAMIMGVLLIWTCFSYGLDYIGIFRYSLAYTQKFYPMTSIYQWVMAMIGGPLDLFLLSGSLVAFVFWREFLPQLKNVRRSPLVVFLLSVLAVYLVTTISVNILKMESSRVWAWVVALPLVFVAQVLYRSVHLRLYFTMAVVLSMLQYYVMQLLLTPCG